MIASSLALSLRYQGARRTAIPLLGYRAVFVVARFLAGLFASACRLFCAAEMLARCSGAMGRLAAAFLVADFFAGMPEAFAAVAVSRSLIAMR